MTPGEALARPAPARRWLKYAYLARIGFLNYLAYRTTVVLILLVFIMEASIHGYLWRAVFSGRQEVAGYTLTQMLTYVVLAWALRSFYNNFLDREMGDRIRKGTIASEFVLPLDVQVGRYAMLYGRALTRLLTTGIPFACIMATCFPLRPPASLGHGCLFVVTAFASLAVFGGINFITGTTAFLTEGYAGICTLKGFLVNLLSGMFIPYALLLAPLAAGLAWLPFRGLADLPISLYLGKVSLTTGLLQTLGQLGWATALFLIGRAYWRWSVRYHFVDGG